MERLIYYGIVNPKLMCHLYECIFYLHPNILNENNVISSSIKSSFNTILCRPESFDFCINNCIKQIRYLYNEDITFSYMTNDLLEKLFKFKCDDQYKESYINNILGLAIKMGNVRIVKKCLKLFDDVNIDIFFYKKDYDNLDAQVKSCINEYVVFNEDGTNDDGERIGPHKKVKGFINIQLQDYLGELYNFDDMNEFIQYKNKPTKKKWDIQWLCKTKNSDIKYEIYKSYLSYFSNEILNDLNNDYNLHILYEPRDIKCFQLFEHIFKTHDYLKLMDLYITCDNRLDNDVSFDLYKYMFQIILNLNIDKRMLSTHVAKWILSLLTDGTGVEKYRYYVLNNFKILNYIVSIFNIKNCQLKKIVRNLDQYTNVCNIESVNYLIDHGFKFEYHHIKTIYKDIDVEYYKIPKYIQIIIGKLRRSVGCLYNFN